ncbi:MAG: hypothetical protein WBF93_13420 [Pirellulales bacterium]
MLLPVAGHDGTKRGWLTAASIGLVLTLVGVSVLRESVRLSEVDIAALYERHAAASMIGGLTVFLVFTVLNIGMIAACIWLVLRGLSDRGVD